MSVLSLHYHCAARGECDAAKRHWHVWGKTPEIAGCPNGRGVCQKPFLHALHNTLFQMMLSGTSQQQGRSHGEPAAGLGNIAIIYIAMTRQVVAIDIE